MAKKITKEILVDIGKYIQDGLSEKEACILCDVDHADLCTMKEMSDDITKFLEKQMVLFKHAHLKEIQSKKSEKNSMWVLEKLMPEQFGSKAKNPEGPTVNIIRQIIMSIQNGADTGSIISPIRRGDMAAGTAVTGRDSDGIPILDVSSRLA